MGGEGFRSYPVPLRGRVKLFVCAALVGAAGMTWSVSALAADETAIGNAQRELKRQQFYYGQITNKLDEPTKAAVRRFQIRRGLNVTGELDGATLAVLATQNTTPTAASSGDPQSEDDRPPARERSQNLVRDDVDILRELESEGTAPPPQPSPVAESPSRQLLPPQENEPEARETVVERNPPPATQRELPPRSARPARESSEVAAAARQDGISRGEILETVDRFVDSWHQPTPDRELSFYAGSVNYFDQGKTPHATIERDQRNYYRRWPEREYSLLTKPEVVRASDDSATVRYRFRYELRNGAKSARGKAEHFLRLERARDGLKVVSVRERKVTD